MLVSHTSLKCKLFLGDRGVIPDLQNKLFQFRYLHPPSRSRKDVIFRARIGFATVTSVPGNDPTSIQRKSISDN